MFVQSKRKATDGSVFITRDLDNDIAIEVVTDNKPQCIVMSEYNASRLLGMLATLLNVRLNKTDASKIRM